MALLILLLMSRAPLQLPWKKPSVGLKLVPMANLAQFLHRCHRFRLALLLIGIDLFD